MVRCRVSRSPLILVEMAPFYKYACEELKAPIDQALFASLEVKNAEQLHKLEERFQDAEKNLGETEISDALIATAYYHTQIGNKVRMTSRVGDLTRAGQGDLGLESRL